MLYSITKNSVLAFFNKINPKKAIALIIASAFYVTSALIFYFLALTSNQEVSLINLFFVFHLFCGIWYGFYYFSVKKPQALWQLSFHSWLWLNNLKLIAFSLCFAIAGAITFYASNSLGIWELLLNFTNVSLFVISSVMLGNFIAILIRKIANQPMVRLVILISFIALITVFGDEIFNLLKQIESAFYSSDLGYKFAQFQFMLGTAAVTLLLNESLFLTPFSQEPNREYNNSPKHADLLWKSKNIFFSGASYAFASFNRSKQLSRRIVVLIFVAIPLVLVLRSYYNDYNFIFYSVLALILGYVLGQEAGKIFTKINPSLKKKQLFWIGIFSYGLIVISILLLLSSVLLELSANSRLIIISIALIFFSIFFGNYLPNNLLNDLLTAFVAFLMLLIVIALTTALAFTTLIALLGAWFIALAVTGIIRAK